MSSSAGAAQAPLRFALDTNVWLDWLVFNDADILPIRNAVARGDAVVFISAACEAELARVLGYQLSGRTLDIAQQTAAMTQCRAIARPAQACADSHRIDELPRCEDPDDVIFLELARDCRADALITKDRDLLALAARKVKPLPFRILTPRQYASEFARDASRA